MSAMWWMGQRGGQPRPAMPPQPAPAAQPAERRGMFNREMTPERMQMIQSLIGSAMQGAQQPGSPALSFLVPIAGAMIGNRATDRLEQAQQAAGAEAQQTVFGDRMADPRMRELLAVLGNTMAPDYLRTAARTQLDQIVAPPGRAGRAGSGGGGGRPPPNSNALITRMLAEAMGSNSDGGQAITPTEQARIDAVRANFGGSPLAPPAPAGSSPAAPTAPAEPAAPTPNRIRYDDQGNRIP